MTDNRPEAGTGGSWTLLTGHGHVLVEIARSPGARMRDLSAAAGITERAVQLIVADLVEAGYISRHRVGRRNRYSVNRDKAFRHPAQDGLRIGPFLDLLAAASKAPIQAPTQAANGQASTSTQTSTSRRRATPSLVPNLASDGGGTQ